MRGKFLSIEGIDGAGKSSHIKSILQFVQNNSPFNIVATREIGGTPLCEKIREMVIFDDMDSHSGCLLDRIHVRWG